jgi:hypothetical protein
MDQEPVPKLEIVKIDGKGIFPADGMRMFYLEYKTMRIPVTQIN